MSDERPGLERMLDALARKVSGAGLHPIELLQRVSAGFGASISGGAGPNVAEVLLHPGDFARFRSALPELRSEVRAAMESAAERTGARIAGDIMVYVAESTAVGAGSPSIAFRFADTAHRVVSVPPGATRRITRVNDISIELNGRSIPVTHAPFSIGRAEGSDLVLPGLAVSRRHAEVAHAAGGGFELVDLGSRNGLVVDGVREERVPIVDGCTVEVGEFTLRFGVTDG